ncbi:MAG: hypothetical protein WBD20_02025 [Pirellulaceae bacterium]
MTTVTEGMTRYTVAVAKSSEVGDIDRFCEQFFASEEIQQRDAHKNSDNPTLRNTPLTVSQVRSPVSLPNDGKTFGCSLDITAKAVGLFGPGRVFQVGRVDIRISQFDDKVVVLHRFQFFGPFDDDRLAAKFLSSLVTAKLAANPK